MRKQLDALMGTNRDGDVTAGSLKNFTDRDVCKYFICGLCPHDLFTNTRKEMGPCSNLHSEPQKIQYEFLDDEQKREYGYEQQLARFLEDLIRECDRTIIRQEQKLKENEAEKLENDPISRQIADLQLQAEKLGEEGNVDEYMKVNTEIEALKQKRQQQQVLQIPSGAAGEVIQQHGSQSQQQKLRVCEVCACYLSKFDSDKRLADHFMGKLHMGYMAIREKYDDLKAHGFVTERKDRPDNHPVRRSNDRHRDEPYPSRPPQEQEWDRDKRERATRSDRDRRDTRDRDRERDTKDRDRNYGREKDRERDRDSGRDRDRKDKDHDRDTKGRSHRDRDSKSTSSSHSSRRSQRNRSRSRSRSH